MAFLFLSSLFQSQSHVPTEIDLGLGRGGEDLEYLLHALSLRAIYEKKLHYRLGVDNHQSIYLSYPN